MTRHRYCQRCGAELDASALCPRCMLAVGMEGSHGSASSARSAPPRPAELAQHFPSYEIEHLVGQGGMGVVYRAKHRGLGRAVALKLMSADIASRPGFAERFGREARVLASLSHPNIVVVHDHGQAGPWWFLAMEFVEGASLRELMRERSLGPRAALAIVVQMCDALQYAHDQGVVHRDIKPDNVLVDRAGRVRILDFGLSKLVGDIDPDPLTRTDQVMGTPHYMAPEQWDRPLEVDHRADIYSLGVVFYELLTGELPLGRFAPPSHKVLVDVRLDEVVLRALEREPERRYQHASAVKTDVELVAAAAPVDSAPIQKRAPETAGPAASMASRARPSLLDEFLGPAASTRPGGGPVATRKATRERPPFVLWILVILYAIFGALFIAAMFAIDTT